MAYDATRVESHIVDILNATTLGFGGAIEDARRSAEAIENARIQSGWEVLEAIAANPQNGYFGSLTALVSVTHNTPLPPHHGEPGIPVIVPFLGGTAFEGRPVAPNQIDSFRNDSLTPPIYTRDINGVAVPHNQAGGDGKPSRVAGRYAIVNGRFKFTGYSAQIPLIQITRAMADTGVPEAYEPTVVKLSITKLVKEGDNLAVMANGYAQLGQSDLAEIRGGSQNVPPVPAIEFAQKVGTTL